MPDEQFDLNKDPFNPAEDFFGELGKDFTPKENEDNDFAPLKGSYVCRVARLTHNIGVSTTTNEPYDFYSLNLQVTEVVEGDKGVNRFLSKRYQNTIEGLKKLWNDLFTAGIEFNKESRADFDLSLANVIDKQMKIRAWSWSPKEDRAGNVIPEEDRIAYQSIKVIKEFKKSKSASSTEVPF